MTPVPQETVGGMEELHDDSIVISGVSTLMPGCESFLDFAEKLYKKERLVIHDPSHWRNLNHPELSPYVGKITEDLSDFDAQFFMVHNSLAGALDALSKKLTEQSFRAVFDSGICPSQLYGKSVAVYIGIGCTEAEKTIFFSNVKHGLMGSNRTMYANRISYFMNLTGPSVTLDSDCCGSFTALQLAQQAINSGVCESAIVGSAKLIRHPQTPIAYHRYVPASPDGKMRCYDEGANGQFMAEAVSVVYLQKYKDAKRVYAQLHHAKGSFMTDEIYSEDVKLYRNVDTLTRFFSDFYDEARIPPSLVEYVDGFGAAVPDFDRTELEALAQVFCKNRVYPLTVGSVASNVGYTEAASGLCSIVKMLVAYQRGQVAANLDCEHPRQDVSAIQEGMMEIASEHTAFRRTFSAVSSFSVGGMNGHALLQGHYKPKKSCVKKIDLPYLLLASGRKDSAVKKILEDVSSRPIDPEELGLLHNIFKSRISQHMSRGYGIYASETTGTKALRESKGYYDEVVRPLWFVYSGMGSQFAEMGVDLMRIPVFAKAIYRCHKVLEPKGVDLISIITSPNESIYEYILNSFVGIAAIQIGLTDVLKHVGLVPDNIIGHSVGELACAYADDCITAEEMILMAYYRGLVSVETEFIRGAMAAVGIGYKKIMGMCPPEIEVACRNGPNSSTISGPADIVSSFVHTLKSKGIFAKAVETSNIAFHSRYIAEAGPKLLNLLKEVVKTPKLRSKRWISTSVPQNKWNEQDAMYSSAEYYTNNLLNPVLFEDMLRFIPSNAVLVEIAPYGLLQAILKRSLSPDCQHIPLTRRDDHNAVNLLEALGKLYMAGYDVDPSPIYPKVEFPVSTETRPLSHLIELVHETKWPVSIYNPPHRKHNAVYRQVITVYDDDYSYLAGHFIEGTKVYPFAAALISVWDTLAMTTNLRRGEVSVAFQDVMLYIQPRLVEDQPLHVTVTIQRGCGRFEVTCDEGVIADGIVTALAAPLTASDTLIEHVEGPHELTSEDVYKIFYERGHEYRDQFQSISNMNLSLTHGQLRWDDNWVTFLDAMLQMQALRSLHDGVTQVDCIKRIAIDFKKHLVQTLMSKGVLNATFDELRRTIKCGGVAIEAAQFKNKSPAVTPSISYKSMKFVPFIQEDNCDVITTLYVYAQIVAENLNKRKVTVYCINKTHCALDKIKELLQTPPFIEIDVIYLRIEELFGPHKVITKPDLVYTDDLRNKATFETLFHTLPRNTYILSQGVDTKGLYPISLYRLLCSAGNGKNKIELARWRPIQTVTTTTVLTVKSSSDLNNLHTVCNNLTRNQKLLIIAPHPAPIELKQLVKEWKDDIDNISVAMMPDNYEDHDLKPISNFDFVFNVLQDGLWGGEYYVPTTFKSGEIENVALRLTKPGDFDSLKWVQIPEDSNKGIPVTVHYAGLNANDVYRAERPDTGEGFGMDFSGFTEKGDRVMGLVKSGAACNKIKTDPRLLWPVPEQWSLEDAATVPLAYAHAFYCLAIRAKLCSGMTVLIHGGAGALGQAAISIALAYGCQVFTTVSDVRKKHFLRKLFPELKEENIGNSRDESFGDMIITRTKDEGCDIVISCVRGALKNTTLKCVASGGVAIDTVQLTDPENCNYGLFNMFRNRSFMLVDFSSIFTNENYEDILKLHILISEGITLGHVRPLSRVTYAPSEAPRALRLLAASRHRGRVLLNLRDLPQMEPRIICSPVLCQLIVSQREDIAVQLIDRLVARGAKKVHLHCTKTSSYLNYKIVSWQKLGVQFHTTTYELNTRKEVEALLKETNPLGSVEGIFVVNGRAPEYLRSDRAMLVNLDLESRKLCRNLKTFAIIDDDESQRDVIENRTQGGLPALLLILQDFQKFGALQENQTSPSQQTGRWRLALDAVERALQSGDSVVYAHVMPTAQGLLMEEVNKIPGVNISKATSDRTTLEEVGVDSGRAKELCHLLKDKFGVTVLEKNVPAMTVAELKNLQKPIANIKTDGEGFDAFIKIVGDEELLSTTDIISMPTLIQPGGMRPDELNRDLNYLIVVPGLEGHFARFDRLCERLKLPAVVLQPGVDRLEENVEELAQRMVDIIRKKLSVKDHYYLVGYEFGAIVVLEMAAILEKLGLTSTVYLLGGTPTDIQNSLESRLASINGGNWENALATHISSLIKGSKCKIEGLEKTETWKDKLEACIKTLRPIVAFSTQYIKKQIQAAYNRINMLRKWNLKKKPLNSKVLILRAVLPTEMSEDELKLLSSDVNIFNLSASLSHAAQDLLCSAVINMNLSPDILEAFTASNRCESSIVNDLILQLKLEENL